MRQETPADSVRRFVAACLEASERSQEEVARLVSAELGLEKPYSQEAVSRWAKGNVNTPGLVLFALARVSGTSLDEFALAEPAKSLADKVDQNAQDIARVVGWVTELAALTGHTEILRSDGAPTEAMTQEQDA